MKIAYFSPLPPRRTGIADYSRDLLPALVRHAEVDLWIDSPVDGGELPRCAMFNYVEQPALRHELGKYDAAVYHMGNSEAHANIYRMLLAHPGVVVLHDVVLHHFFADHCLNELRSPAAYIEEMAYNYGRRGEELARSVMRDRRPIWEQEPARYPLNKRVLDHARGVIVHSDFAAGLVRESHPHLPLAKVDLPVTIGELSPDRKDLRARYGIPAGRVIIASLGFGSAAKRIELILRAVARLKHKDVLYLMIGEVGENFRRRLRAAGLEDIARITGYVDWQTFNDYCNLIDVGIDLRYPTMGESSASVCRVLGAGKPCVVSNLGWFAELPADCVVKVNPAADEDELARCLDDLIAGDSLRRRMGDNARQYIRERHCAERAARAYVGFLDEVRSAERRRAVARAIVEDTGRAMAEIGVRDDDGWMIDEVAQQIALLLGPG
jgi:glycosyltransferase involved in cell wall biosynthesis